LPKYPRQEPNRSGKVERKFVLDHPFVIPGTASIVVTVALGFLWAPLVLR